MRSFKSHYWRDRRLTFPFEIYRCSKHGIYVQRQDKLELVNFSKMQHEAKKAELSKDINVQWFDPVIVNMKCSVCGEKWMQYEELPPATYGEVVFCPNGHSVKKEIAIQK